MTTVGDLIKIFKMLIDLFKLLFSKGGDETEPGTDEAAE